MNLFDFARFLNYILYFSLVTSWLDDANLQQIPRTNRENNRLHEVTGLLLFNNSNFIQLLEGEKDQV